MFSAKRSQRVELCLAKLGVADRARRVDRCAQLRFERQPLLAPEPEAPPGLLQPRLDRFELALSLVTGLLEALTLFGDRCVDEPLSDPATNTCRRLVTLEES